MSQTISKNKLQKKQENTAEDIILRAAELLQPAKRRRIMKALYPDLRSDSELVTEGVAATYLGISKQHLWRWRKGRVADIEDFPFRIYPVPGGQGVRYLEDELRDYVAKHLKKPEETQEDTDRETS